VTWFNKEAFEELLWWWQVLAAVEGPPAAVAATRRLAERLLRAAAEGSYQVDRLMELALMRAGKSPTVGPPQARSARTRTVGRRGGTARGPG
jgi:hypothetical protein